MVKLFKQMIKFGIVGIISTVIDISLLFILNKYLNIHYLIAAAISFSVSVVINYLLSMKFVFSRKEEINRSKELLMYVLLSVCGLLINQVFLWMFVDMLSINVMISKVFATGFVMIWNFVSRKAFIEKK